MTVKPNPVLVATLTLAAMASAPAHAQQPPLNEWLVESMIDLRPTEALERFEVVREQTPDRFKSEAPALYAEAIRTLFARGHGFEALELTHYAQQQFPDSKALSWLHGDLHSARGEHFFAWEQFNRMHETYPDDERVERRLAAEREYVSVPAQILGTAIADPEAALARYDEFVAKEDPRLRSGATDLVQLAEMLSNMELFDRAIVVLEKAAERFPDNGDIFNARGEIHLRQGKLEAAGRHFRAALSADQGNAHAWQQLARIRVLSGES